MKQLLIIPLTIWLTGCGNAPTANSEMKRLESEYADVVFWINRFMQENKRPPNNDELPKEYQKRFTRDRLKGRYHFGPSACSLSFGSFNFISGGCYISWFSSSDTWSIQD